MELNRFNFYKDKVAFNLLAKDLQNAREVVQATDGNVFIGILSKQFSSVKEGVDYVKTFQKQIPLISVGLGSGDPNQWEMAAKIAAQTDPGHVNQVFTSAGYTLGLLNGKGCSKTIVNALISPTGQVGKVKVSTGPASSLKNDAVIDVDTALAMLKDVGVMSVKYFNMHGKEHLDELREVAKACVRCGIPIIEPTGGLTVDNVQEVVKVCLEQGCERVIAHVYSSIIDKKTGLTDISLTEKLYDKIKQLF
ncbi:MAG TPA: 4-hydroxy-2-ketovalerate aldolase [Clostridiaceae bacterium]|nr:4-hydroxy-2-ketovalerate aldolase [Clostridiaceae bacterium]